MRDFDYSELQAQLAKKPTIVITTHRGPDGDAMGSSLALYQVLLAQNYAVKVIVPNSYPSFLHWLPSNEAVLEYEGNEVEANEILAQADLLFCLDFNDLRRTDMMCSSLEASTALKVMIDHHQEPKDFADFTFSVPSVCSTCQLVFEFIELMDWSNYLSVDVAKCIYTGMVTDTGSFRFSSVDKRTHEIVAKLIDLGLDHAKVHQTLFDTNKESRLKLLGYCLSEKLEVLPEYHTAIMSLTREELERFSFQKGDTEGFVNYALSIEGVVFTAFFVKHEDLVKISFRSINQFRANLLSKEHFGGGGHVNAAGGAFEGSMEDAIAKFKKILPNFKEELLANC
jgi:phosphoesterase RecJ-like protein